MDNAFVAIVPTRPGPLFGRPVHPWGSPHRLRPGASPQALRIPPRGGHPALPGSPCRGQRGITPAFGYGALHPSARGTLTPLSTPLPGAPYGPSRLPPTPRSTYVFVHALGSTHVDGSPRSLAQPVGARRPQPPRQARRLHAPAASPPVQGFINLGSLAACDLAFRGRIGFACATARTFADGVPSRGIAPANRSAGYMSSGRLHDCLLSCSKVGQVHWRFPRRQVRQGAPHIQFLTVRSPKS